jgi:hypothetical protein
MDFGGSAGPNDAFCLFLFTEKIYLFEQNCPVCFQGIL